MTIKKRAEQLLPEMKVKVALGDMPTTSEVVSTLTEGRLPRMINIRYSEGKFFFCGGDDKGVFCNDRCPRTSLHTVSQVEGFLAVESNWITIRHTEDGNIVNLIFRRGTIQSLCARLLAASTAIKEKMDSQRRHQQNGSSNLPRKDRSRR